MANRLPPGTPDVLKLVDFSHAEPTTGVPILSELAAIRVYVNCKQKLSHSGFCWSSSCLVPASNLGIILFLFYLLELILVGVIVRDSREIESTHYKTLFLSSAAAVDSLDF